MKAKSGGRKPTGRPPGRPIKELDWNKVDELMICGSLGTEIASYFNMHPDSFYMKIEKQYNMGFSAYLQQKKERGDALIRAKQFQKALSGDNTLLIWLGKIRLKQRDTDDKEVSVQDNVIDTRLENAKLKAENAELREIVNDLHESKTGNVDLQSEQAPEHLVRGSSFGEDIQ